LETGDPILISTFLLSAGLIWSGWGGKSTWQRRAGDDDRGRDHTRPERNDYGQGGYGQGGYGQGGYGQDGGGYD